MDKKIKNVIGYEGLYLVNELGDVISLREWRGIKNRILIPSKNKYGYMRVFLTLNGITKGITVHKIVTTSFLGKRPKGLQVRHLDGNKENNKLYNLCYGTSLENSEEQAFTIHKLIYRRKDKSDVYGNLELAPNLQPNTIFIVDEASMVSNTVGESSVFGSGRLLEDLIEYGIKNDRINKILSYLFSKEQFTQKLKGKSPDQIEYIYNYTKTKLTKI